MALNLAKIGATVEKYMIDEITIHRPLPLVTDEITLKSVRSETLLYAGKAMVSPMGDPQSTTLGEREVQRVQYEVGIPRDSGVDVRPNDLIRVTTTENPELPERTIIVHDSVNSTFFSHIRIKGFYDEVAT